MTSTPVMTETSSPALSVTQAREAYRVELEAMPQGGKPREGSLIIAAPLIT